MATTPDTLDISLRIGTAVYHITVPRQEEKLYRDAERLVNGRLNHYGQQYPGKSDGEYLRMLALDISLIYIRNKDRNETAPFIKSMEALTAEIDAALASKE